MKTFLKVLALIFTLALVVSVISAINIYIPGGLIFIGSIGSFAIGWWMGDITTHLHRVIDARYDRKQNSSSIQWSETTKEEEEE